MDIKKLSGGLKGLIGKYKYAVIVLVIGLGLLLLPEKSAPTQQVQEESKPNSTAIESKSLTEILQSIQGAGEVQVLLSVANGAETVYQTNGDISTSADGGTSRTETVIITDSQRKEAGLINQINPPTYLGAIVVCQGADSPAVKLAIVEAVSKITGLSTNQICVLKMK